MATIQNINATDLHEKLRRGEVVLIDVRESNEFADNHIIHALNLPLSGINQHLAAFADESRPLVFQCLSGTRSKMAAEKAAQVLAGKSLYNLDGGFTAWQAAGLPTTAGAATGMPIMRQVFLSAGILLFLFSLLAIFGVRFGAVMTLLMSGGFLISGLTGFCGMAFVLQKMPWNQKE